MLRSHVASLRQGVGANAPAPGVGVRAVARKWAFSATLLLCALALFAIEGEIMPRLLVAAVFFGSFAVVFALTGRRWFSLSLVVLFNVTVFLCSMLKFSMVAMNLHAYDALFYLFSLAQLNFFWQTFPLYAAIAIV